LLSVDKAALSSHSRLTLFGQDNFLKFQVPPKIHETPQLPLWGQHPAFSASSEVPPLSPHQQHLLCAEQNIDCIALPLPE
jgi:hypothetical protein